MRMIGIELNLLEMLQDWTTRSEEFDTEDWSHEDVLILREIADFIERKQNEQHKKSEPPLEIVRH